MPIIDVKHLSKQYLLYSRKLDRVMDALLPFTSQRSIPFSALNDISFSIEAGESLGIVGVNGSGKSTLLKILTGVLTPTGGELAVNGRVAALLELGAGFHPERTGRENIYFQGTLQGLSRAEVDAYLPRVLEFADIGSFSDQPVKLYSSGMFVRLAFACAIQGDPDILIVDEALAVGDVRFQRKCFQYIEDLKARGTTFIFVSHATEQIVTHCSRALLLSHGRLLMDAEPRTVVNRYLDILFGKGANNKNSDEKNSDETSASITEESKCETLIGSTKKLSSPSETIPAGLLSFLQDTSLQDRLAEHPFYNTYEYRWGNGEATILDVFVTSSGDPQHILPGDRLALHLKAVFNIATMRPIFGCTIKTSEGVTIYGTNSESFGGELPYANVAAGELVHVTFELACNLAPGQYFVSLGIAKMTKDPVPQDRRYDSIILGVHGPANFFGLADLSMTVKRTRGR